jgi:hypothetical protein
MFSTCVARSIAGKLVYKTVVARWRPVGIAALQQLHQQQQLMALRRREENAMTVREGR